MSASRAIFLSYRRSDTSSATGRIYDRLVAEFGTESVFMDAESIPFGVDFAEYLDQAVSQCQIVLVIIGKAWTTVTEDGETRRRLDNPDDFVRIEIESALKRSITVIPVLLDGVSMPRRSQLPLSLHPLVRRNGTVVGDNPRFHTDMDRLIKGLKTLLANIESAPSPIPEVLAKQIFTNSPFWESQSNIDTQLVNSSAEVSTKTNFPDLHEKQKQQELTEKKQQEPVKPKRKGPKSTVTIQREAQRRIISPNKGSVLKNGQNLTEGKHHQQSTEKKEDGASQNKYGFITLIRASSFTGSATSYRVNIEYNNSRLSPIFDRDIFLEYSSSNESSSENYISNGETKKYKCKVGVYKIYMSDTTTPQDHPRGNLIPLKSKTNKSNTIYLNVKEGKNCQILCKNSGFLGFGIKIEEGSF